MTAKAMSVGTRWLTLGMMLSLGACTWFTDFKQQPKIDPWETASDTIPSRGNPQNSVPIYGSAAPGFIYDRTALPATILTMASIQNPVPADSASVNRGRIQFQINCAVCHGPSGMGNGNATKYGFPGIAIGARSRAADSLTDGYIFGMIRNGRGLMPSYNRIEEPDRWDIINYLRSLQGKNGIPADTTHGLPGVNGTAVPGPSISAPTRPAPFYHPSSSAGTPVPAELPASAPAAAPDTTKKTQGGVRPATGVTPETKPEHQP